MKKIFQVILSPKGISIIALLLSASSCYFQFFNEKHSVFYSTLFPILDKNKKELIIPLILKNNGNQTEIIINSELLLEFKNDDEIFYKRISAFHNKESYIILSPNDNKTIWLKGNYEDYLYGIFQIENDEIVDFLPVTVFNDLILKIKITYLSKKGILFYEEREIGMVTFENQKEITRIDYNPIELKKLPMKRSNMEITGHVFFPNYSIDGAINIDLSDSSLSIENEKKLLLIEKMIEQGYIK